MKLKTLELIADVLLGLSMAMGIGAVVVTVALIFFQNLF